MTDNTALAQELEADRGANRELDARVAVALYDDSGHADARDNTTARLPSASDGCAAGTYWISSFSGLSLRTAPDYTSDRTLKRLALAALQHPAPASDEVKKVAEEARCYCVASEGICLPDDPCGPCKAADMLERFASRPTAQPSDLVERVARAICAEAYDDDFDGLHEEYRRNCRRFARAALAAMQQAPRCVSQNHPDDTQAVLCEVDETQPQADAAVAVERWQHVAYFDEGQFHWMSGVAPRDCELYARPIREAIRAGGQT